MSPAPEGPPERRTGWEALERWVKDDGGAGAGGETEGPPPPTCTTCAAPLEPDQTYCLDCGSPTPLAPRLTRSSRSVAILAIALAALGAGAGALAYAVAEGDDGAPTADTVTATTPGAPLPTDTGGFGTLPADTTGGFPTTSTAPLVPPTTTGFGTTTSGVPPVTSTLTTPTTSPTTTTTAPTNGGGGAGDWPAGLTAWTAQVSSVRDRGDAEALRTRLRAAGQEAGVLESSDFTELEPGYYVVFSGTFSSRAEAIAHAAALRNTYPDVFARRLSG